MNTLKLKFSCLIAPTKLQSVMRAFHHPFLVGNYQMYSDVFARSIMWMVYYLSILNSVRDIGIVVVTLVVFKVYSSFWIEVKNGRKICSKALLR